MKGVYTLTEVWDALSSAGIKHRRVNGANNGGYIILTEGDVSGWIINSSYGWSNINSVDAGIMIRRSVSDKGTVVPDIEALIRTIKAGTF